MERWKKAQVSSRRDVAQGDPRNNVDYKSGGGRQTRRRVPGSHSWLYCGTNVCLPCPGKERVAPSYDADGEKLITRNGIRKWRVMEVTDREGAMKIPT